MTSIRIMDLGHNEFTDNVASSPLTSLTSLEFLSISGNHFDIPSSLSPLANHSRLKVLFLHDTKLTIDTKIASSTPRLQLKVFGMSNSQSKGFKVTSIGFLNHQYDLRIMDLSTNDIPGPFPSWLLENNTRLKYLFMRDNSFTTLELPSVNLFDLLLMDISNNGMGGELTTKFWANVPNLLYLNLSTNGLEGSIPHELGSIKSLTILDLSSNNFSGGPPIQLLDSNLSLYTLNVAYNNLQGEFVFSANTMNPNLSYLRLDHNMFTGNLSFLSSHINLWLLDISNNNFIGKIPKLIANWSSLTALDLSKNQLDGLVPQELCNLGELEYLDLSDNNLYGPLPSFFIAQQMSHIHLNRNKLNGTLVCLGPINFSSEYANKVTSTPGMFMSDGEWSPWYYVRPVHTAFYQYDLEGEPLPAHTVGIITKKRFDSYKGYALLEMVGLDFSCNQFSGEIPPEIAIFQDMLVLNLSNNKLTGHIPTSFLSLTKIESMDLSYNNLIGSIPEELTQLNSLEVFNVSYNDLSGAIPNTNQFGAFDESSYYGNNLLCGLPLSNNCSTTINVNCSTTKSCTKAKEGGFIDGETFYISSGVSYITVLLVLPVVLFINPQWRQGWFHYVELVITTCESLFITCYYFVQDGFRKLSNC
ncbi:hypothetical protein EUGRSUZ_C04112 [Eucalyptus grandis]|uniref:Uncharacterized protein n=1 Tax=Eucalyptus grandis TaxID=71139 RepID=A0ACC3LKG9_EUCGR|nr:hypothetical protein EUGRSUZ_C04112 [Eucalyptus grandis]